MKIRQLIKQSTILGFVGSTILLTPHISQALTVEEIINPREANGGWVTDMANILSDRTETELNQLRKVFIDPETSNKIYKFRIQRSIYCAKCIQLMERVTNITLTKPQRVAQQLGSVSYQGYKCPQCSLTNSYSLISYITYFSGYKVCSLCDELTASRTEKTLEQPTTYSTGKKLISDRCHCCDYYKENIQTISCLSSSSSDSSSSCSDSSSSDSSDSSFGGGSSDGDGSGGSW